MGTPLELAMGELRELVEGTRPGERLPPEGDLAARLSVSRLTVREALKVLSGQGLIELGKGRRPVVRPSDSKVLSDYLAVGLRRDPRGLLELTEVRCSLEVLSAGEAARSATPASLAGIEHAIGRMAAVVESTIETDEAALDEYHGADLDFHAAVALASGNRMLALILSSLTECLRQSFVESTRGLLARGGTVAGNLAAHEAVAHAIRLRDAPAAERAMRRHLHETARDLSAASRRR